MGRRGGTNQAAMLGRGAGAWPLWLLALGLMLLGGCSNFRTFDTPRASVVGVKQIKQTDQGTRIEVTVALENPNDVPLPLVRSDYTVELGGRSYTGRDVPARTLPANGKQQVVLPAVVTAGEGGGTGYVVRGSVTYEPPGEIRKLLTDSHIPLPSVSFEQAGQLE